MRTEITLLRYMVTVREEAAGESELQEAIGEGEQKVVPLGLEMVEEMLG